MPRKTEIDHLFDCHGTLAGDLDFSEHVVTRAGLDCILANLPKPTEQATSPAPDAVLRAAIDLRDDLLNRAEWDGEAKVVVAGAGAWFRFNEAIDAALASSKPTGCEGEGR